MDEIEEAIADQCIAALKSGAVSVSLTPSQYDTLRRVTLTAAWDRYVAERLPRELWGSSLAVVVVYTLTVPTGRV